ncbi:MAG: putative ubiquitin-like protein YukD [Oleispira sp.]|jgi:uncharacterized ubiquitin-like protein YukD
MFKLLTLLLLTALATFTSAEQPKFIGYAYDIQTQELLYTEHHTYLNDVLHEVQYKETDGKLFATKSIDYTHSYFAPDFTQYNLRNGEKIVIKRKNKRDDETKLRYLIQYQENTEEKQQKDFISYSPKLIIDAGFDHFIAKHWQALISGEEISIDYLIPSLLDYYELTIKKETCQANTQNKTQILVDNQHCFSISASSFFIGLFSSQLKLTYAQQSDSKDSEIENIDGERIRLMNFQGRSNISDSKGNYQDVNIIYQY